MVLRVPYIGHNGAPLVLPNPARDLITVYRGVEWAGRAHVRMYDMAGRIAYDQEHMVHDRRLALPVHQLASGAWVLEIISGDEVLRTRFIRE
jgi:hypothetical protein